jgi:hypothetical protein
LDRTEIVEVAVAYTTALDTRTWALEPLFTEDLVWKYPGKIEPLHGPAVVVAMMRTNLLPLDATQHLLGNRTVMVDGALPTTPATTKRRTFATERQAATSTSAQAPTATV